MRIKRIEIIGFKSFCDRTVLNIEDPITGVVGPNGCGKSNIVDAIRWCMGEQSAKHLRGQAMGDVIFAGSETRGPAGMAEVSLTFEDVGFSHEAMEFGAEEPAEAAEAPEAAEAAEGAAEADSGTGTDGEETVQASVAAVLEDEPPPIDFAQYSEVTVTRRLFRDGTSGYFINKIPCRLRDVTDFFLGTGVGTKAYSIIEQGRVGMIVSSRPQDRRVLIEEAAGITKFKTKKRAAERKLDQTRQNLLRVNDIVEELRKRLGSLRRQAQKAERYRTYRTELKDIELWIASHRYLELDGRGKVLEAQLEEAARLRDDARTELEAKDAALVAERAELALEERRLSALQEEIYELENRIKLSESKIEYQTREADELESRVSQAEGEIRSLVARTEEVSGDLGVARGELEGVARDAEAEQAQVAEHERSLTAARAALAEAQHKLDAARNEVGAARADMARAESQKSALQRRCEDAIARMGRLQEESETTRARLDALQRQVRDGDKELGSLRQTRLDLGNKEKELQARLEQLGDDTDEAEARVETLRTELHRRRSRLQSLREIQEKYEGFARGTRAVMQRADEVARGEHERVRGLVADVVAAPEQLEAAVEAALGDQLGGVLVDSQSVGVQAVQFLKNTSSGRSAFVPMRAQTADGGGATGIVVEDHTGAPSGPGVIGALTDLIQLTPGYEDIARRLLGPYWVVETLDRAVELHRDGCKSTLVTLDGDIVDGRGVVAGGSREAQGAGVLAQKREIRELGEVVAELEQDLANATARFVSTKTECQQVSKALQALRTDTHDRDIDILGREKDVARSRGELDRHRERTAQLDRERAELEESLAEMGREGQTAAELHDSAHGRVDRYEREQLALVAGVTEGQERVETLARTVTEAKVRAAQLGEKQASLSANVLRLEQTEQELTERRVALEESISSSTTRAAELRADVERITAELGTAREQRRGKAEALETGRLEYERRVNDVQLVEMDVRQLRTAAEQHAGRAGQVEIELHDLGNARANLCEQMAERYRVVLPKELGAYHLRPQAGAAERERMDQLKSLIERMGVDINLSAIEEYDEISKRHDFLSAQKDDLEAAVDQLSKAINKINRTSRKLFQDTFDLINNKFQEVFPRLFRGGTASLQLRQQEGQDLLDAGVEIMARPPGKKNTTVDQLSGGEKALTAVALIFSIFLIKPSPFCLLDEVDAPLDDANVDRYNELVRQMTDRSQFIVITHNKRTMEIADTLYGVTMQEPGASKLVSVNLRTIDDHVAA